MISTLASVVSTTAAATFNATPVIEYNVNLTSNYLFTPSPPVINISDPSDDSGGGVVVGGANGGGVGNGTGGPSPVFPNYIRNTSMVFCIIIMCLGVIGNVMVPIVIFKTKDMRNSTNIFLVNLSVADLMVLLVCTPTVLVEVNSRPETWVLGEEMCKAVPFVELTVAHASVLTILAISFERYYAICKPLKAGYVCTKARASLICLLAWFFAAVFTSPILRIANYSNEEYFDGTDAHMCLTQADTFWPALFFISTILVFFFIPLAILLILYTVIAKTLMEHPNMGCAPTKTNAVGHNSVHKYRKQVVVMLGTVVLAFFVCLLPFRALTLWIIIGPDESIQSLTIEQYYNLLYFCRFMFHLNSAVNPILYNIMSSKFRNGFLKLCGYKRSRKRLHLKFDFGRQNTFNTTSSTNTSSQPNSDSFWNRYSHRNASRHSSNAKDVITVTDSQSKNNNRDQILKDMYVRVPIQTPSSIRRVRVPNGESYV